MVVNKSIDDNAFRDTFNLFQIYGFGELNKKKSNLIGFFVFEEKTIKNIKY